MKNIFKNILLGVLTFGCITAVTTNLVIDSKNDNNKILYSNLEGNIFYQLRESDNSCRFLFLLKGVKEDLYKNIDYVEFNIFQNDSLYYSPKEFEYYTSILANDLKVTANDLGYDVIYTHIMNSFSYDVEYKVVANVYVENQNIYEFETTFIHENNL